MDVSQTYRSEFNLRLCETLLETHLDFINMDSIFNIILLLRTFSKKKTIFIIDQRKLTFALFESLSTKIEQMLFDSGSCLSRDGHEIVLNTFREKKNVLIISLFGEPVLITSLGILKRLETIITHELKERKLVKRHVDSDILLAMFIETDIREKEKKGKDYVCERSYFDEQKEKKDLLNVSKNKTKTEKVTSKSTILPRQPHTTTVTDAEITFPNDGKKYSHPMYPESRETVNSYTGDRYPVQATETDAGHPSFESFPRHMPSSFIGSRHAGQEVENVFSAPDVAYERQIAVNRNLVTSGTKIQLPAKAARYPDYTEQRQRKETFQTPNWPVDNKPNPIVLAECGFFFTEKQDLVRCHHCGIGLKDWVQEDDVLTEHVKHSSSCDFLVQNFGKIRIDRMKMALLSDAPQLPYKIRSPRYQTMEARIASFKDFPKHINLSPQQIAVAGLYFTGNGDLCRCFTCDGGLKDWSTGDDPIKEHATYFPNCTYIGHLKGPEYIQLLQQNRPGNEPMGAAGGSNAITQPSQTLPNLPLEKMTIVDTNTEYSSFYVTQVVQQLGYAEIDVITAKVELEKKGKRFPKAEEIVNTLLDMQERTEHFQTVVSSKENGNDKKYYKKLLQKNTKKFVEDLSPMALLDEFSKSGFLTFVETRDIQELPLTSDKTRAILQKVMMKGEPGYKTFKDCLYRSNQGHLVEILEREENPVPDEDSSFSVSQVVQQLGYAEVDVMAAKSELERKGKWFPTAEDIVNTLLDMQEKAEKFQTVVSSKENKNDLQAVIEENKKLSSLIYCTLCITGETDILFLPCTHHRTCHKCAADLIFCPVCNEFIKEKVKSCRS